MAHSTERNIGSAERLSRHGSEITSQSTRDQPSRPSQAEWPDLSSLYGRLDRIENLLTKAAHERRDSGNGFPWHHGPNVDLTPLLSRLDQVEKAVDQNTRLVRAFLDSGVANRMVDPEFNLDDIGGEDHDDYIDNSKHDHGYDNLTSIRGVNGSHYGQDDDGEETATQIYVPDGSSQQAEPELEHLPPLLSTQQDIHLDRQPDRSADQNHDPLVVDFAPVTTHLEAIQATSIEHAKFLHQLLHAQNATKEVVEQVGGEVDVSPLAEYLEGLRVAVENHQATVDKSFASLASALEALHADPGSISKVQSGTSAVRSNMGSSTLSIDGEGKSIGSLAFSTGEIEECRMPTTGPTAPGQPSEVSTTANAEAGSPSPVTAIHTAPSSPQLRSAISSNDVFSSAASEFGPLSPSRPSSLLRTTSFSPTSSTGAPQFLLSALTSHLSQIQAALATTAAAQARIFQQQEALTASLTETQTRLDKLATEGDVRQRKLNVKIRVMDAHVSALVAGQKEIVGALETRSMALSRTAERDMSAQVPVRECDHVVVPPPRKVGRKIVGYVYGREGMVARKMVRSTR